MGWRLVSTHIERYEREGEAYYVTRCFWQRTDGSVTTTWKDTGEDNEWHAGYDVPTPSDLYALAPGPRTLRRGVGR